MFQLGTVARKPVFGVSDKASFKPVSSATETSWKIEISPVASFHMILFKKRITKALIRLRGCAGWSAPVLFASTQRQVFSRQGPIGYVLKCISHLQWRPTGVLEICVTLILLHYEPSTKHTLQSMVERYRVIPEFRI